MRRVSQASTFIAFAVVAILAMSTSPASAHGDDESDQSRVLVQQAIALIVNTPDDTMGIEDKVNDALKAPDTMGTDLDMVKQAMDALGTGDLAKTRTLLQTSIGAGPYLGQGMPPKVGDTTAQPGETPYAVGEATGTSVIYSPLDPGADIDRGDVALLVLCALAIVAGALLAWLWRPPDTVRAMRRTSRTEAKS